MEEGTFPAGNVEFSFREQRTEIQGEFLQRALHGVQIWRKKNQAAWRGSVSCSPGTLRRDSGSPGHPAKSRRWDSSARAEAKRGVYRVLLPVGAGAVGHVWGGQGAMMSGQLTGRGGAQG